jgi:hypothetical protein
MVRHLNIIYHAGKYLISNEYTTHTMYPNATSELRVRESELNSERI